MLSGSPTSGTLRNNFSGAVGYTFIAAGSVNVTSLCRWNVSGNSQTHTIYLYDLSLTTLEASVTVNAAIGTPGTYQCSIISHTLIVGHTYLVSSCETNGGDQWYDTQSFTADPVFTTSAYTDFYNSTCGIGGGSNTAMNQSFVPVNLTR
jgi:hypothetical protein